MADIAALDNNGGQVAVPQEAAATQFKEKKIQFAPGTPVPVKLRGVEGTLDAGPELDRAIESGDAELNTDPHGAAKAAAAGALRGATMDASDWLAIEGQRLMSGDKAAHETRLSLEGLQKEHPVASTVGELGGGVASLFIPGDEEAGAEGLAAKAPGAVAAAEKALTSEQAANVLGAEMGAGVRPLEQLAQGQMAKGQTAGSSLARTLRAINPYEYVGRAGATTQEHLTRLLGEGRASKIAGPLARWATEGAIIGAANSADEAELGDTPLTGEAILAGAEPGAIWGTGLGLVGAGGARILTSAGRLASRLAEGQIHGTPKQMGRALDRWGPGGLGKFMLERGYNPTMSAEGKYEWARALTEQDGEHLGAVVKDLDGKFNGTSAEEAYHTTLKSMVDAAETHRLAGGDTDALMERFSSELKDAFNLKSFPEPPPVTTPAHIQADVDKVLRQQKIKPPVPFSEKQVAGRAEELAKAETITPQDVIYYITKRGANPRTVHDEIIKDWTELNMAPARDQMRAEYGAAMKKYEAIRADVQLTHELAAHQKELTYQQAVQAVKEHNTAQRVSFTQAREARIRMDKVVPWNYVNGADRVTNLASEVKVAGRRGLEGHIEDAIDKAASKVSDHESFGQYLHAKERYGMSKELSKMTEKGRAREATWFGRPSRVGGVAGHMMLGIGAALSGHPLGGAALMVGGGAAKHFGPGVAAWAINKAAKLAQLKAMRQELAIAARRGVRSAVGQGNHVNLARVTSPNLAPHEMRMTAAEAMAHVADLSAKPNELRARLAAIDPGMQVVAPKAFEAADGALRRQATYLATLIPPRLFAQYQLTGKISPRELTDHEAREFMQNAAVVADPRVAIDGLGNGTLSSSQAKAFQAAWTATHNVGNTTLHRIKAMDRESLDFLHPQRQSMLDQTFHTPKADFTLALQANAQALSAGAAQGQGGGKGAKTTGMAHAAATSKGMAASVALTNTEAQMSESGPPGRRSRKDAAMGGL